MSASSRRRSARARVRGLKDLALVVVLACAVEIGVRTTRLPALATRMRVPLVDVSDIPADPEPPPLPVWARRRVHAVRVVMDRWPTSTCLRRALILGWLLRSLDPRLRLGVARVDGRIEGHAWVEVDGRSLDPMAAGYRPLTGVRPTAAPGRAPEGMA